MNRLNLVSAGEDRELQAIRDAIGSFESVSGLDELITVLQSWCAREEQIDVIDAIGHSRSGGLLLLGSWLVDDSPQTTATFSELLRPLLQQLRVGTIRLLGCSTATTDRARNAIRQIARVTQCCVLGTTRYISHHDYVRGGFHSEDTLFNVAARQRSENPARSS